ncbi:MAG: RNA-binding protein [Verrucomicrobiota bacterium]|jgi:RNA-binding protein
MGCPIFAIASWRRPGAFFVVIDKLTNAEIRRLKAEAQKLKATFKIGKQGLTPQFVQGLNTAFEHHELIKVKFDEFKAEKKELAPQMAAQTSSHLVWLIGNVAVLYRPKPMTPAGPGDV